MRSYPEAGLLRLVLDGGIRLQVRPSGTEPKVKLYGEAVDTDPAPYLDALAATHLTPEIRVTAASRILILLGRSLSRHGFQ